MTLKKIIMDEKEWDKVINILFGIGDTFRRLGLFKETDDIMKIRIQIQKQKEYREGGQ